MALEKKLIKPGNGVDRPRKGDTVTMEYTGWIYNPNVPEFKGNKFDSSVGRGDLQTTIGTGNVIKGWDDGIIGGSGSDGMTLGEKSTLIIPSDFGYGERGFPGHIPPNAKLVFEVELKAINDKRV